MTAGKSRHLITDASIIVGVTLLLFILIETGLSLLFLGRNYIANGSVASALEPRINADTYHGAAWVKDYYHEFNRSSETQWMSYVYWRRKPFVGRYTNIDAEGIRRTPGGADRTAAGGETPTIFMFGGSAMWGTGARDDFTLPALVARAVAIQGTPSRVVNFGESGYVSTQEVIALMLQIQKGRVPDIAVFYDGPNDVYAAYQQRVAGLPQNELNRVREFNLSTTGRFWSRSARYLEATASGLSTTRFFRAVLNRFGGGRQAPPPPNAVLLRGAAPEAGLLARDAILTYWRNLELVAALAERYRFKCLVYWQPTIFGKHYLTEYERSERRKAEDLETFYRETDAVRQQTTSNQKGRCVFQDLSGIFSDAREPLYVDWLHLGESGNQIIADRMARDVLASLDESRHD